MKIKSTEFIAFSASSMMLTALGIDIMLPAFAQLRTHFGLGPESTATANIVMFFFMGQIAQLVFGVFSDRFGRIPILRIGLPLYILGGIVSALAPNLETMYIARFVAGVGASAVFSTTVAAIRDRFVGDQMAKIMSLVFTIFLFTPVVAPFLGSFILSVASWQWVFLVPPLFGVVVFAWSFRLEETLLKEMRTEIKWKDIIQSIRIVITNRTFLRYTTISTLLFASFSSYISSSERIVGEIYGKPHLFNWIFGGIGLLMALGTFLNSYLAVRFGAKRTLRWLLVIYSITAILLLLFTLNSGNHPYIYILFGAIAIMVTVNLSVGPNSSALAMEPLGNNAGLASAIYGTSFFFIGSLLGSVINFLMVSSVLPLVLSFLIIGLIALFLLFIKTKK